MRRGPHARQERTRAAKWRRSARRDIIDRGEVSGLRKAAALDPELLRPLVDVAYWSQFTEVRRDAAAAFAALAVNDDNLESLAQGGALGACLAFLATAGRADAACCRDALLTLSQLVKLEDVKVRLLAAPTGLPTLLRMARNRNNGVRRQALSALLVLLASDNAKLAFLRAGGLALLAEAVMSDDLQTRRGACQLLRLLYGFPATLRLVLDDDNLSRLCDVLRRSKDEVVLRTVLTCFASLSDDSDSCAAVVRSGALRPLIDLMPTQTSFSVLLLAVRCLRAMAGRAELQVKLVEEGAIAALLDRLQAVVLTPPASTTPRLATTAKPAGRRGEGGDEAAEEGGEESAADGSKWTRKKTPTAEAMRTPVTSHHHHRLQTHAKSGRRPMTAHHSRHRRPPASSPRASAAASAASASAASASAASASAASAAKKKMKKNKRPTTAVPSAPSSSSSSSSSASRGRSRRMMMMMATDHSSRSSPRARRLRPATASSVRKSPRGSRPSTASSSRSRSSSSGGGGGRRLAAKRAPASAAAAAAAAEERLKLLRALLGVLSHLSEGEQTRDILVEEGVVDSLLMDSVLFARDRSVLLLVARILVHLSDTNWRASARHKDMVAKGAMRAVNHFIAHRNYTLVRLGCRTLAALAVHPDLKVTLCSKRLLAAVLESGSIPDEDIRFTVARTIAELSEDERNRDLLVDCGVLTYLRAPLEDKADDGALLQQSLRALSHLASSPTVRRFLVHCGLLYRIIRLAKVGSGDVKGQALNVLVPLKPDYAALKIQSAFRGHAVRNAGVLRARLLAREKSVHITMSDTRWKPDVAHSMRW